MTANRDGRRARDLRRCGWALIVVAMVMASIGAILRLNPYEFMLAPVQLDRLMTGRMELSVFTTLDELGARVRQDPRGVSVGVSEGGLASRPGGEEYAASMTDGRIGLFELATGQLVREFRAHDVFLRLRVEDRWSLRELSPFAKFVPDFVSYNDHLEALQFSPDGRWLWSIGGTVRRIDMQTGAGELVTTNAGTAWGFGAAHLVLCDNAGPITWGLTVFDLDTGTSRQVETSVHPDDGASIAVSNDGRTMACFVHGTWEHPDDQIVWVSLEDGSVVRRAKDVPGSARFLSLRPDGTLWDTQGDRLLRRRSGDGAAVAGSGNAEWSIEARPLFVSSRDGALLAVARACSEYVHGVPATVHRVTILDGETGAIRGDVSQSLFTTVAMDFVDGGESLLVRDDSGYVRVVRIASDRDPEPAPAAVAWIAWNEAGTRLATRDESGRVSLWTQWQQRLWSRENVSPACQRRSIWDDPGLAFSADGTSLFVPVSESASAAHFARLDAMTGRTLPAAVQLPNDIMALRLVPRSDVGVFTFRGSEPRSESLGGTIEVRNLLTGELAAPRLDARSGAGHLVLSYDPERGLRWFRSGRPAPAEFRATRSSDGWVVTQSSRLGRGPLRHDPDGRLHLDWKTDETGTLRITATRPSEPRWTGWTVAIPLDFDDAVTDFGERSRPSVTSCPLGRHAVVLDADRSAHLVDLANGAHKAHTPAILGEATAAAFSSDGLDIAIGFEDGSVFIWNLMNWTLRE